MGTRGSALALKQTQMVIEALRFTDPTLASDDAINVKVIRTSGDRIQDRRLADIGGKALFTREIERALITREIDIAVHSAKDVENVIAPGTLLAATLPREDRRDALIARDASSIDTLPEDGTVGTASIRRQAQLLRLRPDLKVVLFRGNVETRLDKLAEGAVDATFLAVAGLNRLGLGGKITERLSPVRMMPAAGQGIITVQARVGDGRVLELLAGINNTVSAAEFRAERAVLARLGGTCHTPIAAMAEHSPPGRLKVAGKVLRPDGTAEWYAEAAGDLADAGRLGDEVGTALKQLCDPDVLSETTSASPV